MIEIMVVMVIIGILIIGVTAATRTLQRAGRNTQRKKAAEAVALVAQEYKGNYNARIGYFGETATNGLCEVANSAAGTRRSSADLRSYGISTVNCTWPLTDCATSVTHVNSTTLTVCANATTVQVRLEGSDQPFSINVD